MRLRITPSIVPSRDRTFRGHFYRAGAPDKELSGILDISTEGEPTLDVNGSFFGENQYPTGRETVFGRAHDGSKLTLAEATFRHQDAPWFNDGKATTRERPPVLSEVWGGWAVAVGAHLPDGHETKVSKLAFRSPMLTTWAAPIAPEYEYPTPNGTIGAIVKIPDDLTAALPFGDLALSWAGRGKGPDIEVHPEIRVDFHEPQTIGETWASTVLPLLQFFSLAVGQGDSVRYLRYAPEGPVDDLAISHGTDSYGWEFWENQFEWVTSSWMAKDRGRETPSHIAHLIPAMSVEANFGTLLPAWFETQSKLSGPLLDYFAVHMSAGMTIEEAFYRVTRALEVTHGVLDSSPKIPAADFKMARDAIKVALAGHPYRDFLLTRMKYLDAPSLRERLLALFDMAGPRLKRWSPSTAETFVPQVVRTRDRMTHSNQEGPLTGDDLYNAYVVLDLLMQEIVLLQLGYSAEDADKEAFKTDLARFLLYPA